MEIPEENENRDREREGHARARTDARNGVIRFADNRLAIRWQGAHYLAMLNLLFGPAFSNRPSDFKPPDYILGGCSSEYVIHQHSEIGYKGPDLGEIAGILMDSVIYDLADRCRLGLMFHAAALSWKNSGILIPGISGLGKSTLAAWFTGQGFDYLTDELVYVPHSSIQLCGFNRALLLKAPSVLPIKGLVDACLQSRRQGADYLDSQRGLLISARAFNRKTEYGTPDVRFIFFAEYRPGAEFALKTITPAQTAMRLMGCLVNARNLPGHGLPEVSALSKRARAFTVRYSNLIPFLEAVMDL